MTWLAAPSYCLLFRFLREIGSVFSFGSAIGMASEMFSLLCPGCIKGDGTFLDSAVTQYDRYIPTSFYSILSPCADFLEGF